MEKTYLQINVVNTLTILIMAGLGFVLAGFVLSGLKSLQQASQ